MEHISVSGCGNDTILNLFFEVAPDGMKISSVAASPGTTHASILLQSEALRIAIASLQLLANGCSNAAVRNTRFESFGLMEPSTADSEPSAKFHPWWETWTLAACNRTFDVPMDFIPDERGTTIVQRHGIVEH